MVEMVEESRRHVTIPTLSYLLLCVPGKHQALIQIKCIECALHKIQYFAKPLIYALVRGKKFTEQR